MRAAGKIRLQPGEAGADQVRLDQRPFPERLRHRARDPADVEEGRHRGGDRDHRIRQIFRAQSRRQAAGGDALQLGQRDRRSGDLRRLSAQSENAVLGLEGQDVGEKVLELFNVADYQKRIDGYRALNRFAVENGATIPLLQSVQTVVRKKTLTYVKYENGWILADTMDWA